MPIHLEPLDVAAELEGFNSILIVSCPVCPPMSLAMQTRSPFIELFQGGLTTGAFEAYIQGLREPLEKRGIRTGVYSTYLPCPTMCLWTKGQRRRFLKRAEDYEAVLVLGCESAAQTARDALEGSDCQVIQAMRTTGIANGTMRFRFPLRVDFQHITYSSSEETLATTDHSSDEPE